MKLADALRDYPEIKKYADRIVKEGITSLYPPQAQALKIGYLKGKNLLMCTSTSSGKTLIAELGIAKALCKGGKAVYLCPLKSLAVEKYKTFSKRYNGLVKVGLSIGDYDKVEKGLNDKDLIITSYEKFDSLLRHKAPFVKDLRLAVIDEIHVLNDLSRGPTLEVIIARLKELNLQLIALSATIGNPRELALWLNAELVVSDFRPVRLYEGVYYDGIVNFKIPEREYRASDLYDLCRRTINKNKQVIVFVNTRRSAEAEAERLSKRLGLLKCEELYELRDKVLNALSTPTRQCKRLGECILGGVAFNHAGLVNEQKELIEDAFRQGIIKVIVCTTVLAYGVSLPAYQVILRDLRRYTTNGLDYIPVSEWLQIKGRAGRAGYDSEGESIIITKSMLDYETAVNNYLEAQPEEIVSKLGADPMLRFHALSLVSEGSVLNIKDLVAFFKKTLHGMQYGSTLYLQEKLLSIVDELAEWGFIKKVDDKLAPTKLGIRISELYIDPLSAKKIIDALKNCKLNALAFLHLVSMTSEVPCLSFKREDYEWVLEELALNEDALMIRTPNPFNYEYEGFIKAFKTALLFNDWICEHTEDDILEKYNVPPGMLRVLLKNAEWMTYSCSEIARLLGIKETNSYLKGLILRLRYGVREDLLSLVSIKGIGRVRARKLFKAGYKNMAELKNADKQKLARILGEKIAERIISSF